MKPKLLLTTTSLISIVLFLLHWSYEITNGMEPGTLSGFGGVIILVVWLCGTLLLADRRSGYIIMLIGGILGVGVLVLHMMGRGMVGGRVANTNGIFFWVASLIALGVSSALSAILAGRGLWNLRARNQKA